MTTSTVYSFYRYIAIYIGLHLPICLFVYMPKIAILVLNRLRSLQKCPPNSYVAVGDLCEYAVDQSIRLQELPEHVPVGEMPRTIELCAQMRPTHQL